MTTLVTLALFGLFMGGMIAGFIVGWVTGSGSATSSERAACTEMREAELRRLKIQVGKEACSAVFTRFEQYMQEMAEQAK